MTQCQDEFRNLSGCVIKILTAGRILQISISWCQIEAEIRSFPTMHGKGGVYVVKIGEIKVFVQKLCLKQGFFEDTNLDHLTSGWPGTHCSEVMPISMCSPKNMGGKLQFLVCPLFCPPVPSIELPSFFALVMPLYMPSTDNLKCPLYILPFFNGMPSRGMLYFQMC